MGLPDKHDKREFRHFAKIDADGHVVAVLEIADGQPDPADGVGSLYVEITDLHPYEFTDVTVPLDAVQAAVGARDVDVDAAKSAVSKAQGVEINPFFQAPPQVLSVDPSDETIAALADVKAHLRDLNKVPRG